MRLVQSVEKHVGEKAPDLPARVKVASGADLFRKSAACPLGKTIFTNPKINATGALYELWLVSSTELP